jgi:ribosome-binding ATPase YchF (GTP1/OBG family)
VHSPAAAFPVALNLDLANMPAEERESFCQEMGLSLYDRAALLRRIMAASGQMLFFTAGEKEVRTWMIRQGGTAEEAADGIHSDLAKGFVRAETMSCNDLFAAGSEREVKARNLMRKEARGYVIQDGDILHILANT